MRSSSVQLKKNGRGLVAVPRFRKKGRDEDYGLSCGHFHVYMKGSALVS